jgi:outer membrane protein assembly factor BamB
MHGRSLGLLAVCTALLVAPVGRAAAAVPAWTSYRHDAARSGIDPDSTRPVSPSQTWQTPALDGEVYGQPLVYGPYVYVATENDTVYKLDAATGGVLWSKHLATPEPASAAPCGDIAPTIGITGTPVIDPATNRIYAVGAVSVAGVLRHELFALDLGSGQPIADFPITVDPPYPAGGGAVNQLQRPGLALDDGRVLIGYGGNDGDCATYWGWLVSAPTNGTDALSWFQVDATHLRGAIWAAGNAPAVDAEGNAFIATGNGGGNSSSDPDFGDSVVKLNSQASPLDWWAPTNWQALDSSDADLGSSMPTLLPGNLLFESGKDGNGYLLDGARLGHVSPPAVEVLGFCSGGSFGGSVFDSSDSTIYVACLGGLRALVLEPGSPPSLTAKAGFSAPAAAAGPPMIAGGRVWMTTYTRATLYGLNPISGEVTSRFTLPERGSQVNHFASPSAGGGRLFVASGDQVTAYTIARPPAPSATTTALESSSDPAPARTRITLTAAVAPAPDAGTVTFTAGRAPISGCAGIAVSPATAGRAVCRTSFRRAGKYALIAKYSGDPYYAASASAALAESVRRAPRLSHVSIRPRRFPAKHRATLRASLSEAGVLTVEITRLRHGHAAGRRCSRRLRRSRSCRVRVTLQRLRFHAHAGRNEFKLSLRRLAPRGYTALIFATGRTGRRSRTVRIAFSITPPRRAAPARAQGH